MVVYHSSQVFLDDLSDLKDGLLAFVNVRALVLRTAADGVVFSLKAVPDQRRLGQRLKGDRRKVEAALSALSFEALLKYEREGEVVVEGHRLTRDDVTFIRECNKAAVIKDDVTWKAVEDTTLGVLVAVNVKPNEELLLEGYYREVQNRVQRLKKKAGLLMTETRPVTVYWALDADPSKAQEANEVRKALDFHRELLSKRTNSTLVEGPVPGSVTPLADNSAAAATDDDEKERQRLARKREVNGVSVSLSLVVG
jgi:isoleucyl-tRNA synthetase